MESNDVCAVCGDDREPNILEQAVANRAKSPQCDQCRHLGGDHVDVQATRLYRAFDGWFVGEWNLCAAHRAAEEKRGVQCQQGTPDRAFVAAFRRACARLQKEPWLSVHEARVREGLYTGPMAWYECSGQSEDGYTTRHCMVASSVAAARDLFRDAHPGHRIKVTTRKMEGKVNATEL